MLRHDLRTPLAVIQAQVDVARLYDPDERTQSALLRIESEVVRLAGMVDRAASLGGSDAGG